MRYSLAALMTELIYMMGFLGIFIYFLLDSVKGALPLFLRIYLWNSSIGVVKDLGNSSSSSSSTLYYGVYLLCNDNADLDLFINDYPTGIKLLVV